MAITHILFFVAFALIVVGTISSDHFDDKHTWRYKVPVSAAIVVSSGLLLVWLDYWLLGKKQEQDKPVVMGLASKQTAPPFVPWELIQKSNPRVRLSDRAGTGTNVQQQNNSGGNNVEQQSSGNNSPNMNCPNGICAGRDINGNPTVNNYGAVPRVITDAQKASISRAVGFSLSPPDFDGVACLMGDGEACRYADQISAAFKDCGWGSGEVSQDVMDKIPEGVLVAISPQDVNSPPKGAVNLHKILSAAGIEATGMSLTGKPKGHFAIFVGSQPPKQR